MSCLNGEEGVSHAKFPLYFAQKSPKKREENRLGEGGNKHPRLARVKNLAK